MTEPVYVLGGWQSDFAAKAAPVDGLYGLLEAAATSALDDAQVDAADIDVAHAANVGGELFCFQGHLGGMVASIDPAFAGLPTSRHEAACASGSVAILAAMAEIEAGRYDVALVVGAEVLRNIPGPEAGKLLGAHLWSGREAVDEPYPWPSQFGVVSEEYDRRYGVDHAFLERIGELNFANAKKNPNAQTRGWDVPAGWFEDESDENPVLRGLVRKRDCGRITDGSAAVVIASAGYTADYARRRGIDIASVARIKGWGHHTAPMLLATTLESSKDEPYVFPHIRQSVVDALQRAELADARGVDAVELHDCFTFSEYLLLDHLGLTEPGKVWQLIEDGDIEPDGSLPVNMSGGLLGLGHPVGATGIRMVLDGAKQVAGRAGHYQVAGAKNVLTLNVGGSFTTVGSFVVGVD